jgi:hypothetical protein
MTNKELQDYLKGFPAHLQVWIETPKGWRQLSEKDIIEQLRAGYPLLNIYMPEEEKIND